MEPWLVLRVFKFIGVALFAGGVMLSTSPRSQRERLVAAWGLLPLGFVFTWLAGYGLLKSTGVSMGAPWVSASMLLSLAALHLGMLGARTPQRQAWRGLAARACLGASIGAMVGRGAGAEWAMTAALGAAVAGTVAWALARGMPTPAADPAPDADALVLEGFWRWSRLEALSAIALFLVYLPAKYGAGVVLDGGAGWFGWVHGVLIFVFVNGLGAAARAGGWSAATTALGFAAAMVPGGGLWFEHRMRRAAEARAAA